MRLSLAMKFSVGILGVILLAVSSSIIALVSSRHIAHLMQFTVEENLPSVQAAEELEIALLEQRGFVSSYILDDGNREWLAELATRRHGFDEWFAKAWATAHTSEERDILEELKAVYREYVGRRNEAVSLYDRGDVEEAKAVFVHEVNDVYDQAYELCESFIRANQRSVSAATDRAYRQTRTATWTVGLSVGLTVGLGLALLWLFFAGVLLPLRSMIADARHFSGERFQGPSELPTDELRAVGAYLRTLMDDVADTRSNLEASRSRLMNAEKLATVGKLAASVAHEMRNPLTAVKMWLFSIRSAMAADPELDHKFEIVSEEITRLESVIRNFLEFSRPPALKLGPHQITELLERTLELFRPRAEAKHVRLLRQELGELPSVLADGEQLRQVFANLLDNAIEAVDEGGEIHVSAAADEDKDGRPMVVVRIQDSGGAMPDDVRERVFEPFFTTKEDGTGLGLCIAARIMARHNGRLVLESSTNEGTRFAVWTPTAGAKPDEQDPRG